MSIKKTPTPTTSFSAGTRAYSCGATLLGTNVPTSLRTIIRCVDNGVFSGLHFRAPSGVHSFQASTPHFHHQRLSVVSIKEVLALLHWFFDGIMIPLSRTFVNTLCAVLAETPFSFFRKFLFISTFPYENVPYLAFLCMSCLKTPDTFP